jgi:hypothetical protein
MPNPYAVFGGVTVATIVAAFGILAVPGWVAYAQDAAAMRDLGQVSQAQANSYTLTKTYASDIESFNDSEWGVDITLSQGVKLVALEGTEASWCAAVLSQTGTYFAATGESSQLGSGDTAAEALVNAECDPNPPKTEPTPTPEATTPASETTPTPAPTATTPAVTPTPSTTVPPKVTPTPQPTASTPPTTTPTPAATTPPKVTPTTPPRSTPTPSPSRTPNPGTTTSPWTCSNMNAGGRDYNTGWGGTSTSNNGATQTCNTSTGTVTQQAGGGTTTTDGGQTVIIRNGVTTTYSSTGEIISQTGGGTSTSGGGSAYIGGNNTGIIKR